MSKKLDEKKEQQIQGDQLLARAQRQELRNELNEDFARRPRMPQDKRRIITFSILGALALLVILFGVLVLLPAPAQVAHAGVVVGSTAPDFTLPVQGGSGKGSIRLSALHGHPVVINFWSESCQPCLSEIPYLRSIYARSAVSSSFTLLGINEGDPRGDIGTFGQTYKVNYPLLFDTGSKMDIAYNITSLPQTYFVDSSGVVRYVVPQQLTVQGMQQGLQAIGIDLS